MSAATPVLAHAATTGLPWVWLVSRASGLGLLVVLSASVALGVATRIGAAPRTWSRFVVAELHRSLALFGVAFLVLHVVTAVIDPYVSIGWWATFVPFVSHFRSLAIGAGALAVDLFVAVLVTSVVRRRLGFRAWRAVHWLAYLAWPAALAHSVGAGSDLGIWWVAALVWGSVSAVALAVGVRLAAALRTSRRIGRHGGLRLGRRRAFLPARHG